MKFIVLVNCGWYEKEYEVDGKDENDAVNMVLGSESEVVGNVARAVRKEKWCVMSDDSNWMNIA